MKSGKYEFWIEMPDEGGKLMVVEWRGLSEKQAKDMYSYTERVLPEGVKTYGWGLMSWGGDWK